MLQHSSIGWGQMGTTRNNIAIDYMIHLHIVQVYVDVCFVWSSLIVVPATKRETTRFISYTIAFKWLFFFYFKRKHDSCYNPWIEFSVKTTFFLWYFRTQKDAKNTTGNKHTKTENVGIRYFYFIYRTINKQRLRAKHWSVEINFRL